MMQQPIDYIRFVPETSYRTGQASTNTGEISLHRDRRTQDAAGTVPKNTRSAQYYYPPRHQVVSFMERIGVQNWSCMDVYGWKYLVALCVGHCEWEPRAMDVVLGAGSFVTLFQSRFSLVHWYSEEELGGGELRKTWLCVGITQM
jgi:hypothetical protein